jgi:serine/threonine protein kinase
VRPSSDGSAKRAAGRYVLGDLLGRGGMAEVFAGHSIGDHGFQKPVAIKRLLPELASDHVFVERLIEEAKLLVGMQHGNIVSVIDLARDGDDVFLVMEFVDGPSLRQLLTSRGARGLSLGVATYIVQAAAAGLEFAHNRPGGAIIHADISPSNLLLTTSGEVRVADFGIARREGGGHGVVEGKWAYMAPEQARGEPLTPRSDVFALGVVLYELICGAHPFGRQVTHEERDSEPMRVIPPRVVKPGIPTGLDAICMRALAHDPRARYKSMQSMIDAIVEERFANHLREAASDLAQAIRDANPGSNPFAQSPRTVVTDRPVTLMTRSLLREPTPARPFEPPSYATPTPTSYGYSASQSESRSESERQSQLEPEVTRGSTSAFDRPVAPAMTDELARAMRDLPPMFRAGGASLPSFTFSAAAILPARQDLASVVGGHTMASHAVAAEAPGGNRLTIAILAFATLIGIGAALAFHLKPSGDDLSPVPVTEPVAGLEQGRLAAPPPSSSSSPSVAGEVKPTFPAEPAPREPAAQEPRPPDPPAAPPPAGEPPPADPRRPVEAPVRPARTAPPAPPPARAASRQEPGILRVHTTPWAWATVGNDKQSTPAAKFRLPPGHYTVRLSFPTLGITETHHVTIESTRTFMLNINKEDEE